MKVRYVGEDTGVSGLSNGKIYEVIGIEYDLLRVIDNSGEDYLYSSFAPGDCTGTTTGIFKVVEDDKDKKLEKLGIQPD